MKGVLKVGVLLLLLIAILFGAYLVNVQFTGLAVYQPKESCFVSFDGNEINLANYFKSPKIVNSEQCLNIYNKNREEIIENICLNSDILGRFSVRFLDNVLVSEELECGEQLSLEGAAITMTGEFNVLHIDYFDYNKEEYKFQIKDSLSGEIFTLKNSAGNNLKGLEQISPGTQIKVRAIKKDGEMILNAVNENTVRGINKEIDFRGSKL